MREYLHTPVMVREVVGYLRCSEGGTFVDATIGEGGHTVEILRTSRQSKVIGIDWDEEILEKVKRRVRRYSERVILVHDSFVHLPDILHDMGIEEVDGLLFDLGVSSFHFLVDERGFSIQRDGPLDMRMDARRTLTAHEVINWFPLDRIEEIIRKYGEERWAARIARAIGERRQQGCIESTRELAEIVSQAIPRRYHNRRIHPATKTFLALRIAVNDELKNIETTLQRAPFLLKRGGRVCVISFQSLEDRIVKRAFAQMGSTCTCPPSLPRCVCGGRERVVRILTRRPVIPHPEEVRDNPRARSAKLRVAERF